ncbi:MAG: threonine/serine dehydratase [Gemmatimonadota bacterium]
MSEAAPLPLVSAHAVEAAASGLRGVTMETPLLPAHWLSERIGAETRLKCENLQRAGAFKIRGAYTMLARLTDQERARGVIAYSSGNHAQGVALAARMFKVHCTVVMPTTAPEVKRAGAAALGADIVQEGTTSVERQARAEALAAEHGYVIVPAFDHPDIIAGQGTVGLEILDDWADVEAILVPIGGGGLAAGIALWVKSRHPECMVVGVEPAHADAMARSLEAGEPVTIEPRGSIADGLMPVRPGDLTFAHARAYLDGVVRVTEEAIAEAAGELIRRSKLVVEFSGAATTAALLSGAWQPEGRRTAAVLSGGNMDPRRALELLGGTVSAA